MSLKKNVSLYFLGDNFVYTVKKYCRINTISVELKIGQCKCKITQYKVISYKNIMFPLFII